MNAKLYIRGIRVLCVATLLGMTVQANAQENKTKEKNLNREMTLEREYDPSVQDASKVNSLPVIKDPQVRKIPIDYSSFTMPMNPLKEINILSSGKIQTDMYYSKKRGYFNFGGGNYLNLNGDLGYHILSTDKDQLGIYFAHRSTNGKIKYIQTDEKQKAKLNDNLGVINYIHNFEKVQFKLGAAYGYSGFNYYGYPGISSTSALPTFSDKNQVGQQIYFSAGMASKKTKTFNYMLDLDFRNFSYKYGNTFEEDGAKENVFGLKLDLNNDFGGNKTIGLTADVHYLSYDVPDKELFLGMKNRTAITLSPYFKVIGENWNLKLGANAMIATGDGTKVYFSPNITADIEVAEATVLYGKFVGDVKINSLYEISQEARYADPTIGLRAAGTWIDGTIGIKSGVAPGIWFDVFAGYKMTDNDHTFIPDLYSSGKRTSWRNVEQGFYMNSRRFLVGATFKYSYQQLVDLSIGGIYNSWNGSEPTDKAYADDPYATYKMYNRPGLEITAGIDVKPIDKLCVSLNYYLSTDRYTRLDGENLKMKNINELNLKGAYNFNDTFGVYLKLNNLMFQRYDMFYGYTSQGFNAMVGININF